MRRGVLFTGIAIGTCLVVLAYSDGFHPALPGLPHLIGVTLGAVLVWLALAAVVTWLAELLRRHHKALPGYGKRGTLAAARFAGKGGRSVTSRLAAWAGSRWATRHPADSAHLRPGQKRCRACGGSGGNKAGTAQCPVCNGWGSAPPDPAAPEAPPGTVCTACGRAASPDDPVLADGGGPVHRSHALDQQASYNEALDRLRGAPTPCKGCGHPGIPGARTCCTADDPRDNPASAPAPAVPTEGEEMGRSYAEMMAGTIAAQSSANKSRITPDRRAHRAANSSGGKVPSEWGPVVGAAADFEAESDEHLLGWLGDQVAGMAAYAEALIETYETSVNGIGVDPKGLTALHDVADAVAHAAETMHGAKGKFTEHYELPREFAANGGVMTHDGRWVTGEGG